MGIFGLQLMLERDAPKCKKEETLESYANRVIAVDAIITTDQYHMVAGRTPRATPMLTNKDGDATGHLHVLFSRTIRLLKAGIKPVYVFEGEPPDVKKQLISKRVLRCMNVQVMKATKEESDKESNEKLNLRDVKVTKQNIDDCKKLLGLMGVPVVEALSDAEAQCASLCKSGKVHAVLAQEMDSLTFGAPKLLQYPIQPKSEATPVLEFEVVKVLEELNLSMDQFIDLGILSGCDYCDMSDAPDRLPGLSAPIALNLIREHGCIEKILENLDKDRYKIPYNLPYQDARMLFKEPRVLLENVVPELKWSAPDEEGLVNFLVKKNDFDSDVVRKAIEEINAAKSKPTHGRLESLSKHVGSDSVPIKRKEQENMDNTSEETSNKKQNTGT